MAKTKRMLAELLHAYLRTLEIDESGDATMIEFQQEAWSGDFSKPDFNLQEWESDTDMFEDFLIWANGPNWDPWIWTAEKGDVPPK